MLRAGHAPVAYRRARAGGDCVEPHYANSLDAPARAGRLQPPLGFSCALRRCSLVVPVPRLALRGRRESFTGASLRVRCRGELATEAPQGSAPITVWVKRMDVAGARYGEVENVDLEQTVSKFTARWMAKAKLDLDPSLVTLRLVPCGVRKPTAEEEQAAAELDPFDTLGTAGISDGCKVLAFVAGADAASAALALTLHELDTAVQQMRNYKAALAKALNFTLAAPCYVTVPPHPSLQFSPRRRFAVSDTGFTFMRRQLSQSLAGSLEKLLKSNEPGAFVLGPTGAGKSHLLCEASMLLATMHGYRVVYNHDCASWADFGDDVIGATLFFLRSVAMAFVDDADVLKLCRSAITAVATCSTALEAERTVCTMFFPQLGDLCKRLNLKVFFVFDQHNSLTPELRAMFPYSLPEARLLRVSQLRGVGMVVISASANNEYYLKVALQQPPWPTFPVNEGFLIDAPPEKPQSLSEMEVFVKHHHLKLEAADAAQLYYETNCFPLELAYFVQARDLLKPANENEDTPFQAVLSAYLNGCVSPQINGRRNHFFSAVRDFDLKLANQPRADNSREQLVNGIVCMQLQLPTRSLAAPVLLNRQLCFMSDRPFGSVTTSSLYGVDFIHPVTPLARTAAIDFYLSTPSYNQTLQSVYREIFATSTLETSVRGFILQRYLIQQLRGASSFALSGYQYGSDHVLSPAREFFSTRQPLCTVEWYGCGVPPSTLNRLENLLLVPLSVNYPGVDFFIWNADTETLILFQVTLSTVAKHSNFWPPDSALQTDWKAKLGVKKLERVWITPHIDAGQPCSERSHAGQWACSLALLKRTNIDLFALLQHWRPSSQLEDDSLQRGKSGTPSGTRKRGQRVVSEKRKGGGAQF